MQTDDQLHSWPTSRSEEETGEQGRDLELVAINRAVVDGIETGERETRIAVLWVKWEDGIAYRQSCGFVREDAWRLLGPVDVDLVLG